jgi:hypothetical protein
MRRRRLEIALIVLGILLLVGSGAVIGYSAWSEQQYQARQPTVVPPPRETLPARLPIPTPGSPPRKTAPTPAS